MKKSLSSLFFLLFATMLFAEGKNEVAIIYYSWGGNTKYVVEALAKKVSADIFRIELETPYSSDYKKCISEAKEHQAKNARPAIKGALPVVDGYKTIILAYPNWWSDIPMHFYTLLEGIDLAGKTVIPLCTHGGGGFARSVSSIKKLAPKATVKEGIAIRERGGKNLNEVLATFVKNNNLK